jgi:hypothetical protein
MQFNSADTLSAGYVVLGNTRVAPAHSVVITSDTLASNACDANCKRVLLASIAKVDICE